MLKKSTKPSVNTFNCIDMMLKGAKKKANDGTFSSKGIR